MTNTAHICLGTVQFGVPYGITNKSGQVNKSEVLRILDLAAAKGITLLDTAQAYGTAETVLGQCWPTDASRRLISKLPAGAPPSTWEDNLLNSLHRLKAPKLDGYLLHRASDLLSANGKVLLDWLESLRDRDLVKRIGVSIYEASELDGLPLDRLQLVQLPLSVYDQRLIRDGTVEKLKDLGISVHVRSVFLQGLILQSPRQWPVHLSPMFRDHHARWLEELYQLGLTPLESALGFVRACQGVEAVLVGVLSRHELDQVLQAWSQVASFPLHSSLKWAWGNALDIDPRRWPPR